MNYKELIPERKSIRDYKRTLVKEHLLNEIKDFAISGRKLIEDIEVEILIKNKDEVYEQLKGVAGYNGNMLEAPHYMVMLSDRKDYYIENTGYIGENLMLKAFELGVGSCWITFSDESKVKENLGITSDKELTALIALGYAENKTKVINQMKTGDNYSKADMRVVEDNTSERLGIEDVVFMKEWGNQADESDLRLRGLLDGFHYARLAPSTLNRQPWRFIIDDDKVVLAVRDDEHTNEYEEKIDAGIVMLYFEAIIDNTLFDLSWTMGKPEKDYHVPKEFLVVSYCHI